MLIQETRHEILMFYNPENGTITYPSFHGHAIQIKSGYGPAPAYQAHGNGHSSHRGHEPTTSTTLMSILTTLATTTTTSTTTTTTTPAPSTTTINSLMDSFSSTENLTVNNLNETSLLGGLIELTTEVHHRMKRGLRGPYSIYECRRSDIMGALVQNASPFLFPCTIEYSLVS